MTTSPEASDARWPVPRQVAEALMGARLSLHDYVRTIGASPHPHNVPELASMVGELHQLVDECYQLSRALEGRVHTSTDDRDVTYTHMSGGDPLMTIRAAAQELAVSGIGLLDARSRLDAARENLRNVRTVP